VLDKSSQPFAVYSDGSCWTGDRVGGWGWVIIDSFGEETHSGGSDVDTTISRMEICAAIDPLETIYEHCGPSDIVLYSDSEYMVLGIKDRTRKRNHNRDLWDWLDNITDAHLSVEYNHVRGHQGNHYNEIADDLAGEFRKGRRAELS
jgi:ribonuclease HI